MRRYGALTRVAKLRLLLVFLLAQVMVWLVFTSAGVRLSLALLSAAVMLVAVKTRKPVSR